MYNTSQVAVIGAAILDINAKSYSTIKPSDSNPGRVALSSGGVARNIAENLTNLNIKVSLVAAFGDDIFGNALLVDCNQKGIDMSYCEIVPGGVTPTYVTVLDSNGKMDVAIVGETSRMSMEHIKKHHSTISKSSIIVVDTNLNQDEIEEIVDMFKGKDIYADTVSLTKAARVKDRIGCFHTIKMNRREAQYLSGYQISDDKSLKKAAKYFLDKGAKRTIIYMGSEGIYYSTKTEELRHKPTSTKPVNAAGAGNALMSGIIYCTLKNKSAEYTVGFSQAMAYMTLMSEGAVNREITLEMIDRYNMWRNY